jgi:hypothetical protein
VSKDLHPGEYRRDWSGCQAVGKQVALTILEDIGGRISIERSEEEGEHTTWKTQRQGEVRTQKAIK